MIEGTQPEPINGEDALILYPNSRDSKVLEATPKIMEFYRELKQVRDRKDDLIKMEEHLKTKLKDKLGSAERIVCSGRNLVSWKSQTQNRLDTNAFKSAHPDLYKKHLTQTKTRRFICH